MILNGAVADLHYGKCKIKCDFLLAVETLKKIVKQLFQKFTLNRRRRAKRVFLSLRHDEKRLRDFHLKMCGYINRSTFIQK